MDYQTALMYTHTVTEHKWLLRNLTVTRKGCHRINWILFVKESGYDGQCINDTYVFTDRG